MLILALGLLVISGWLHLSTSQHPLIATTDGIQVFTPDWGVGATLVMMGHPPIAIGDKRIYPTWVKKPKLSDSIIDIGIRGQPNTELLTQLQPDLILDTFFYKENRAVYDPSIPVYEVDFGIKDNVAGKPKQWSTFVKSTHQIGDILVMPIRAEEYLIDSQQRIINAGKIIRDSIGDDRQILVAGFWDARQLNVDTINSHTTLAASIMGLDVIQFGDGSRWGNASIPMHRLYELPDNTCLIITEPIPATVKYDIAHSPVWQRSPFFRPDACVYIIDPVWSNGGIEVMVNFAENLAEAVTTQTINEFSYEYVTQRQ